MAVLGDLKGQEDWLKQVDSLESVRAKAKRLDSIYDRDGCLDSNGKIIREEAIRDPLREDPEGLPAVGSVDQASFEMAEHLDVRTEIENLPGLFKQAGLNRRQHPSLMMRRNGEIMSHKDVNEWKRSQRAIDLLGLSSRASELFLRQSAVEQRRLLQTVLQKAASGRDLEIWLPTLDTFRTSAVHLDL